MQDRDIGRRLLARIMDYLIFVPVILLILSRGLRFRPAQNWAVTAIVLLVLFFPVMLLTEPCELALCGTTIGKALLGLYPYGRKKNGGRKPSWAEAFTRTWRVFSCGYGFFFHYRDKKKTVSENWQVSDSYECVSRTCGAVLPVLFLIICVAAAGAVLRIGDAPKYGTSLFGGSSSITAEEFAANFNDYCRYYGADFGVRLQADGTFERTGEGNKSAAAEKKYPEISFEIEDGKVVGVTAEFHAKGKNGNFTSAYTQLLELLSRSLFEPENGWRRDKNYIEALQQLRSVPGTEFRSFDSNWNGGMISCSRTLTDASYDYWHDEIIADSDETEGAYDLTYRASLEKES